MYKIQQNKSSGYWYVTLDDELVAAHCYTREDARNFVKRHKEAM